MSVGMFQWNGTSTGERQERREQPGQYAEVGRKRWDLAQNREAALIRNWGVYFQ